MEFSILGKFACNMKQTKNLHTIERVKLVATHLNLKSYLSVRFCFAWARAIVHHKPNTFEIKCSQPSLTPLKITLEKCVV